MPCAAPVRGKTDTKLPWSDVVNNDPCAQKIVTSVGGVNTSAENLCSPHWQVKHGLADYKLPVAREP